MQRRGQIFLILTILVISFLVGISTTLINLERSDYFNPSPDSSEAFEVWDLTITSINQVFSTQIAVNTQSGAASGIFTSPIQNQLNNIETYIISRGFSASINMIGDATYVAPITGNPNNLVTMSGIVAIEMESPSGVQIQQQLQISIQYSASIVGGILSIERISNSEVINLRDCIITPPGGGSFTDNGNGSYTLVGAGLYTITTPDGVIFDVTN